MTNTQLEAWVEAVAGELGIDTAVVDIDRILDAARGAAEAGSRPAAPLSTFLVGYAVGRASANEEGFDGGESAHEFDEALGVLADVCDSWNQEMPGR
ncbi:DUF6457 domain-containing protein [Demequina sediminicola]|uniref:DUF6457 domain-containing protein n=1 Tax=Demequina sediminicola TaxID=1095026 RepID=UPI00078498A0|nr:DUF6457 domain-containing protein [Demequina sediminicola]